MEKGWTICQIQTIHVMPGRGRAGALTRINLKPVKYRHIMITDNRIVMVNHNNDKISHKKASNLTYK